MVILLLKLGSRGFSDSIPSRAVFGVAAFDELTSAFCKIPLLAKRAANAGGSGIFVYIFQNEVKSVHELFGC